MMGKTHAIAGGLFAAAAVPPTAKLIGVDLDPAEIAVGVGIGTIAGLLPDIDHPNSMLTKGIIPGTKVLGGFGRALGWILSIPPRIIGVPARATMNHRGGTHSVVFMLMWSLLAAPLYALVFAGLAFLLSLILDPISAIAPVVPRINVADVVSWLWHGLPAVMPLVALSVFFGYLSHLVTDSLTKVPVPWPWPFSKRRLFLLPKPMRITTGESFETMIIRPLLFVALIAVMVLNIGRPIAEEAISAGQQQIEQQDGKSGDSGKKQAAPAGESRYDQP